MDTIYVFLTLQHTYYMCIDIHIYKRIPWKVNFESMIFFFFLYPLYMLLFYRKFFLPDSWWFLKFYASMQNNPTTTWLLPLRFWEIPTWFQRWKKIFLGVKNGWWCVILLMVQKSQTTTVWIYKPCKYWDKLHINWCRISSINSSSCFCFTVLFKRLYPFSSAFKI